MSYIAYFRPLWVVTVHTDLPQPCTVRLCSCVLVLRRRAVRIDVGGSAPNPALLTPHHPVSLFVPTPTLHTYHGH